MRILQVAAEAVPFAKTGGLADVVGALTEHLARIGHDVQLILPRYGSIRTSPHPEDVAIPVSEIALSSEQLGVDGGVDPGRLVTGPYVGGARVWFYDQPQLFDRAGLYGEGGADYPDNLERFSMLCRAAVAAARHSEFAPDIVHCHDWHTGLVPAWLTGSVPTVFSVHNLAYQGRFGPEDVRRVGLARPPAECAAAPLSFHAGVNLMLLGLVTADQVTTVSPTYAAEIQRTGGGFGLEGILRGLQPPVQGILNGLDTDAWDPATDEFLPEPFHAEDLSGKRAARRALLEEFELDVPDDAPVFGLVSRLVDQKGIGLFSGLRDRLAAWAPAGFVFVGTGAPVYENMVAGLADLPNVASRIAFSERLAHLVEAGSDFFLMPSTFEPCGLNQMISQRYGTIPIVHRTGGLADTVVSVTSETLTDGSASGIAFEVCDTAGLVWAIEEALRVYAEPQVFGTLRSAIMRIDHSWNSRIRMYEEIYSQLGRRTRPPRVRTGPDAVG